MKSIYSKVPKASRLYCLVAVLFLSHHAHSFALSSQPTKWPFNPPHDAQVKVYAVSESGMVNTYKSIDWQAQWWPIAFESVTDKTRPYPFELLSIPIVIWWDNNGKRWNAV